MCCAGYKSKIHSKSQFAFHQFVSSKKWQKKKWEKKNKPAVSIQAMAIDFKHIIKANLLLARIQKLIEKNWNEWKAKQKNEEKKEKEISKCNSKMEFIWNKIQHKIYRMLNRINIDGKATRTVWHWIDLFDTLETFKRN